MEAETGFALHKPRTALLGPNAVALLDLLRALAANLVLLGHATEIFGHPIALPAGLIGVGIFFLLSGFLILQSSQARLARPGPHFLPYLIDRFARIFTAYLPALVLVAIVEALARPGHWGQEGASSGGLAFLGNLLLLQDYPLFQAARRLVGSAWFIRPYNTAEPFWTIPIEFWIYVVFGLGCFGLVARERLPVIAWPLLLVALPVVLWNAAAGGGNGLTLVWVLGALAAGLWAPWRRRGATRWQGVIVLAAGAVVLVGRGAHIGWNFQDIGMALAEAALLLGALAVLDAGRDLPRRLRAACTGLAAYSYSLYLVHNTVLVVAYVWLAPALGWGALWLGLLASHLVALALYAACERHYRRVGTWLKRHILARQR